MAVVITQEASERTMAMERARGNLQICLEAFQRNGWIQRNTYDMGMGGFYHFVHSSESWLNVRRLEKAVKPGCSVTYPVHFWFCDNSIAIYEKNPEKRAVYLKSIENVAREISERLGVSIRIQL